MKNTEELKALFEESNAVLKSHLEFASKALDHPVTKGNATEGYWREFLQQYLPSQYGVCQGFIIDNEGMRSDQIDVIIYDALSSPYVINTRGLKFIPVENVLAVLEVKQMINAAHLKYVSKKIASVRKLIPSYVGIDDGSLEEGSLYPIIGGIIALNGANNLKTIEEQLVKYSGNDAIDIGCCANHYSFTVQYGTGVPPLHITPVGSHSLVKFYKSSFPAFSFLFHLLRELETSTRRRTNITIDIDAYLEKLGVEIFSLPVSKPLF